MNDMNLVQLIEEYGSEEKCRAYLEELRWPNGPVCPRCENTSISRIRERNQFDCNSCRYQFSVTAGTLMHDSHLPLWKWFLAIYLVAESKKGISAKQLERMLKVSYKTAWYMAHRIRDAMGDDEQPLLRGIIEADETWIGAGTRKGTGHWREGRTMILGVVERGGEIRLKVGTSEKAAAIQAFVHENIDPSETDAIYTDSAMAYKGVGMGEIKHESVNHFAKEWRRGDAHTQTIEGVWGLFKRAVAGSYHVLSVKHMPAYLDEMEFRFNNRHNPFLFRDTLLVMLNGDPLPYKKLVGQRGE